MAIPVLRGGQLKVLSDQDILRIDAAVLPRAARGGGEDGVPAGARSDGRRRAARWTSAQSGAHPRACAAAGAGHGALAVHPGRAQDASSTSSWTWSAIYTIGGSSALSVLDLDGDRRPATLAGPGGPDAPAGRAGEPPHHARDRQPPGHPAARVRPHPLRQRDAEHLAQLLLPGPGAASRIRDQVEMAAVILGRAREALRARPIFTIVLCMISPLVQPAIRAGGADRVRQVRHSALHRGGRAARRDHADHHRRHAGGGVRQRAGGDHPGADSSPGHPCIFSIASGIMDMSTGDYSGGAPETACCTRPPRRWRTSTACRSRAARGSTPPSPTPRPATSARCRC